MSSDAIDTHKAFAESLRLNFPLVVDRDRRVASAFGVLRLWGLLPFPKRVTFVVDGAGTVRSVVAAEFDVDRHADEAIAALKALPSR